MSNKIRNNVFASFCFFAVLFAAAVGVVDAQSEHPIDDDDVLACVTVDDVVYATPVALKAELENATGQVATVETTQELINRLPNATTNNGVRFEGGMPTQGVQEDLEQLGYVTMQSEAPTVQGAQSAYLLIA